MSRLALIALLGACLLVSASAEVPASLRGLARRASADVNYCSVCMEVAHELEGNATADVCKDLHFTQPPASLVCDFIVDKATDFILKEIARGYNATTACRAVGACSSEGCPCGQCEAPIYGTRCLSLPNHCPSNTAQPELPLDSPAEDPFKSTPVDTDSGFCFDGACEAGKDGCCLTCF